MQQSKHIPRLCLGVILPHIQLRKRSVLQLEREFLQHQLRFRGEPDLFDRHNALENLQSFVSDNAQRIHNIEPPKKTVVLERTPYKVPPKFGNVVPMFAESEMPWSICQI